MKKLVIHPPVDASRLEKIRAAAGEAMTVVNAGDPQQARQEIADADAFFGKLTPELLAASSQLRWVQSPTASLEHFIFPEMVEHPLQLTNMRGLFYDVIADHVFGYILSFARQLPFYFRNQLARKWEPAGGEQARSSFAAGPGEVSAIDRAHLHLSDLTLGIVGLGSIGSEVARRGRAFSMRCVAVDPRRTQPPEAVEQVWPTQQLDQLLEQSDFVVIAAPHTPETVKMFRRPQFEQMKPTAYLINIGRGVIVDLSDLTAALEQRELAGAALDVFEEEPLPPDHPLWEMPNVIITPHVAAASPRIAQRHLAVLLENVRRFAHDQPLENVADKTLWF